MSDEVMYLGRYDRNALFFAGDRFVYVDFTRQAHTVTGKIFSWECAEGHEWQDSLLCQMAGSGCPECTEKRRTATPDGGDRDGE